MTVAIDLTGQPAIVTGSGKGIGRAIGLERARASADVFALSGTASGLEELGSEIRALGVR